MTERSTTASQAFVDFGARRSGGWALTAVPIAIAAVVVVVLGTHLTFFSDDWSFVLHRSSAPSSVLQPSNGHFVALSVIIFRALIALFGLDSQVPFRIALAAGYCALGAGVFVFVRGRLGVVPATVAVALLLLLGPAWEDFLWTFQIGFVGSLAAGVWALVLLERDTRRSDGVACALLVIGVTLSNVGLVFVPAAALVALVRRRAGDLWIAAVPALVFVVWWLGYGHKAPSNVTVTNVLRLPEYVLDSAAAALASVSGLNGGVLTAYAWGPALLVAVVAAFAIWIARRRPPLAWLPVVASPALAFWLLTGMTFIPGREPIASRFQLIGATLTVMTAAELFRTVRWRAAGLAAVAAVGLVATLANVQILKAQGYDFFRTHASFAKADLGALDIMRGHVGPQFQLTPDIAQDPYLHQVTAGSYYRQSAAHGTPAYSEREIAAAPPDRRHAADNVMVAGYALALHPIERRAYSRGKACQVLGQEPDLTIVLSAGATARFENKGAAAADIALSRFAPRGTTVPLGSIPPRGVMLLTLPRDTAATLWRVYPTAQLNIGRCG